MIDLTINKEVLKRNIERAKEKNIIIPTFKQMANPELIPDAIKEKLKDIGLLEINPLNLFRVSWKNEATLKGGQYTKPNYIELPKKLTGVDARIVCLVGKWFPTGCHKVGASFGCLVPRLVTGQFDSTANRAVWPSTGNFCRGGAFNSKLLSCKSVAILPEGMSKERFDWLKDVANEVIQTPGTESNVKEIFDKTWELRTTQDDVVIFNQFEEMGNYLWHYYVTGKAFEEVFETLNGVDKQIAGICLSTGSAGTIASGDYIKQVYPTSKIVASEALQCSTILNNGFGDHRIEGIGDKHIPWIHNVKNTDLAVAIDDNDAMAILRLFNEENGKKFLKEECHLTKEEIDSLSLIGISGICNILTAIKFAKYYELKENDIIGTVLTDSVEMYKSRLEEMNEKDGKYTYNNAMIDYNGHLMGIKTDNVLELTYPIKKRIHNLKYYTWVEQQGKNFKDLNDLWYNEKQTWEVVQNQVEELDKLITEFNNQTGLINKL